LLISLTEDMIVALHHTINHSMDILFSEYGGSWIFIKFGLINGLILLVHYH